MFGYQESGGNPRLSYGISAIGGEVDVSQDKRDHKTPVGLALRVGIIK